MTELGAEPGPRWLTGVAWLVARLPWRATAWLGGMLGGLVGSVLRVRRRHVEEALEGAGLARALAPRVYASLATGVFELLWFEGRGPQAEGPAPFEMTAAAAEALREAHAQGRGVVVATAHTGNWDLNACGAGAWIWAELGATLTVVTKRLSWRSLDRFWQRLRAARGVHLVRAEGATRSVRDALAEGGIVALLVDQAPERSRQILRAPFLGKTARHDLGPALLAARAKAPLVVISGVRYADGRHRLELLERIEAAELKGREGIARATERIAGAVEDLVRRHPEQWLWLHRRWK